MPVAADYPFLDFFWSMLLIFLWIAWIFILFRIIIDVFRRDESGLKKTAWVIFLIFIPFLGVLVYLIVNGSGMTRRDMEQSQAAQAQMDTYIRQTAGGGGGRRRRDRQGEGAPGQRGDQPGGVRPDQAEGARLIARRSHG